MATASRNPPEFRLPGPTDRTAIVGRTGSGKTVMATFLLSEANIDKIPHIIIDMKGEEIFRQIQREHKESITEISVTEKIPRRPGIYIVRPTPYAEDEAVNEMLWRVWDKGRTGVYIDEGHLMPNSDAFKALLVAGRSRRIPMIVLSQRPVWVPREVFSEASHQIAFDLSRTDDRKLVGDWVDVKDIGRFQNYRSHWYDVVRNRRYSMHPAPPPHVSIENMVSRAPRRSRWF